MKNYTPIIWLRLFMKLMNFVVFISLMGGLVALWDGGFIGGSHAFLIGFSVLVLSVFVGSFICLFALIFPIAVNLALSGTGDAVIIGEVLLAALAAIFVIYVVATSEPVVPQGI